MIQNNTPSLTRVTELVRRRGTYDRAAVIRAAQRRQRMGRLTIEEQRRYAEDKEDF